MEFLIGATSACGAVLVSNPMDVLKTRMQLQGELKERGKFTVIYRNIFHAAYAVAKADGIASLQKGLAPALGYQIILNGIRFGLYQKILNSGIISRADGSISTLGCVAAGAGVGIIGGFTGSPFYLICAGLGISSSMDGNYEQNSNGNLMDIVGHLTFPCNSWLNGEWSRLRGRVLCGAAQPSLQYSLMVKTQLQSQAAESIAVGYQHKHQGLLSAMFSIAKKDGIKGLWRGSSTSIPRVGVGSASQLFTFSKSKDWLDHYQLYPRDSWQSTIAGAMASGLVISSCMSPFDVIATRIYNQGLDSRGKGLMYSGIFDCVIKIFKTEGVWGFYKGWSAIYFRIGPHSFLNLMLWDRLTSLHKSYQGR